LKAIRAVKTVKAKVYSFDEEVGGDDRV